jgi:hypothetical protein
VYGPARPRSAAAAVSGWGDLDPDVLLAVEHALACVAARGEEGEGREEDAGPLVVVDEVEAQVDRLGPCAALREGLVGVERGPA